METPRGGWHPAVRLLLGLLLSVVALNAVGGGYYALSGAPGVPVDWLQGSPFSSYVVPGVILLVVVGGSSAAAAVAVFARARRARPLALAAGAILLGWIVVQVAIIGYVSWLQPAMAVAAVLILALARRRPGPPAPVPPATR